jgi:hypothetical protein
VAVAAACALVVAGGAAATAAAETRCSARWHTIRHAETGKMLQPNGAGFVYADGTAGVAPWDQYVLFCRDPDWEQGHYGVYSNRTGRYWFTETPDGVIAAYGTQFATPRFLFDLRRYDDKFWTIRFVGEEADLFRGNYLRPAGSGGLFRPAVLVAHTRSGVLSGANLFTISPSGDLLR